jgi:hypothetical protein
MAAAVLLVIVIVGLPRILQPERTLEDDQLGRNKEGLAQRRSTFDAYEPYYNPKAAGAFQDKDETEESLADLGKLNGEVLPALTSPSTSESFSATVAESTGAPVSVIGGEISAAVYGASGLGRVEQQVDLLTDKKMTDVSKGRAMTERQMTTPQGQVLPLGAPGSGVDLNAASQEVRIAEAQQFLVQAQVCDSDAQCAVITDLPCPLACVEAVRRDAELDPLRSLLEPLQALLPCAPCPGPAPVQAACRDRRCVIVPVPVAPSSP